MPKFLMAIGDDPRKTYILFRYKTDYDTIQSKLHIILTDAEVDQILENNRLSVCEKGHAHTCALSLIDQCRFGDILMVVSFE